MQRDLALPVPHAAGASCDSQLRFSQFLPDFDAWLDTYAQTSARWRRDRQVDLLPYGDTVRQRVRCHGPARRAATAMVFLHGGCWRASSAHDYDFVDRGLGALGAPVYNLEYRLMPAVRMHAQIADVRAALEACLVHHRSHGGRDLLVVGYSAGAHLAVCASAQLQGSCIRAVIGVSGFYELQPIASSFLQARLQLDEGELSAFSPARWTAPFSGPRRVLTLAIGGEETRVIHEQAEQMASAWRRCGGDVAVLELTGRHHMATVFELNDPRSTLITHIQRLAQAPTPSGETPCIR